MTLSDAQIQMHSSWPSSWDLGGTEDKVCVRHLSTRCWVIEELNKVLNSGSGSWNKVCCKAKTGLGNRISASSEIMCKVLSLVLGAQACSL